MINKLPLLAELAPEMCQSAKFGRYQIGEYEFGANPDGTLHAKTIGNHAIYSGQPALDWLQGALQTAIRTREMTGAIFLNSTNSTCELYRDGETFWENGDTPATALLDALLEAVRDGAQ